MLLPAWNRIGSITFNKMHRILLKTPKKYDWNDILVSLARCVKNAVTNDINI